jgi:dihydrofolate reductase
MGNLFNDGFARRFHRRARQRHRLGNRRRRATHIHQRIPAERGRILSFRTRHVRDPRRVLADASDADASASEYILEFGRIWRAMPKVVFSSTLDEVVSNTRLVPDNAGEEVQKLKQEHDKDLWIGGAGLAAGLIRLGLVDEYGLFVPPVLLGSGTPMFPSRVEGWQDLRLVDQRRFASGAVYLRYRRAKQTQ